MPIISTGKSKRKSLILNDNFQYSREKSAIAEVSSAAYKFVSNTSRKAAEEVADVVRRLRSSASR